MVVAEERPRVALQQSFSKLFKDIGLSPRAVSTTFGSRVNVAICLQVTVMISCLCGELRAQAAAYPPRASGLFVRTAPCLILPIGKMKMMQSGTSLVVQQLRVRLPMQGHGFDP